MKRAIVVLAASLAASPALAQGEFTVDDVEKAVQKGAAYLQKAKMPYEPLRRIRAGARGCGYYQLGYDSLTCFALLRSGVDPKLLAPRFAKMRKIELTHTYCVSLYLLALEAKHVVRKRIKKASSKAKMRTQARVAKFERKLAAGGDTAEIFRAAKWLINAKSGPGTWSYTSYARTRRLTGRLRRRRFARAFDNSNVQFAVYGLHAAAAAGFDVPAKVWGEIGAHFLKHQVKKGPEYALDGVRFGKHAAPGEGKKRRGTKVRRRRIRERRTPHARGWSYTTARMAYGSMSAAGLGCVAMAEERLLGRIPASERYKLTAAKYDGIAWLVRYLREEKKARVNRGHHYYYLWSLEKAFDATGVEEIARGHHWWRTGADWLLGQQRANGSWGSVQDTAFALLFLNRGTLPMWEDGKRFGRVKTGAARAPTGPWDLVHLDDGTPLSVSQTLTVLAKLTKPKTVRETLKEARAALEVMGPGEQANVIGLLVPLLDSRAKSVRRFGRKQLKELLGSDDPEVAGGFAAAWKGLVEAGRAQDLSRVASIEATLKSPKAQPVLRRRALQALVELRAVEALPAVIDQLHAARVADRRFAWTMLYTLAGPQRPFDPAGPRGARKAQVKAWRAWWKEEGKVWEQAEVLRRDVLALGGDDEDRREGARSRLLRRGKAAVPRLIAALEEESLRDPAHDLLKRLTGQAHPAEPGPWQAWWRTQ